MDESFLLPVNYNDKELFFPSRLLQLGYTHRFQVEVNDTTVFFEPDEERAYRAIVDPDTLPSNFDVQLLQAIASAIEALLR